MSTIPFPARADATVPPIESDAGLLSWVASVDHKQIGVMYIVTTLVFFCAGGVEALLMRWQLAAPRSTVLSPTSYNQLFTMHGTTMIFLVVMPVLFGFSIYFVPLMIGANDMAFPRLNALGYWTLVFGGVLLYFSPLAGGAPDKGWFAYAPMTEPNYSMDHGMDFYSLGLLTTGIGSVATGVNLIVTILTMRAPGMGLRRVPLFVWMVLVNSFLVIFALPSLNVSLSTLWIDRHFLAHFFDPNGGGQPILWQHLFWSFGHPEVYIMVLPAWGMISEIIPVFSRKPIYGYSFIAMSTLGVFTLSLLVWGHHMFTVGMGHPLDLVFGLSSFAIAVFTGIKVFNWLATMWDGAIRFTTSMLFAIAFIPQFVLGGITGVSFAAVPVDWEVEDTYYVVAHMHYVLFGGTAFAVLASVYYWFPKMTGRLLSERWGRLHFWQTVVGFNLTFFIQHILGLMGMPRRVYTYPDLPGWHALNLVSSLGAAILGLSVLVFVWNVVSSLRGGQTAGDNPWEAPGLEWATTSPPPYHNFALVPPVRSRRPLYDLVDRAATAPDGPRSSQGVIAPVGRLSVDESTRPRPAGAGTPPLGHEHPLVGGQIPAAGTHPAARAASGNPPLSDQPATGSFTAAGPHIQEGHADASARSGAPSRLSGGLEGAFTAIRGDQPFEARTAPTPRETFWNHIERAQLGMLLFLMSESVFFIALMLAFAFYRDSPANTNGPNVHTVSFTTMIVFSVCLWLSSATIVLAGRAVRRGRRRLLGIWLGATIALGLVFLFGEAREWLGLLGQRVTISRDVFGAVFFTLTGFHGLHVIVGLLLLCLLLVLAIGGVLTRQNSTSRSPGAFEAISLYWHFVDIVWIAVFSLVYLWPLVG